MKPLPKKRVLLPWHRWKAHDLAAARFDEDRKRRDAGISEQLLNPSISHLAAERAARFSESDRHDRVVLMHDAARRVEAEGHRHVHAQLSRPFDPRPFNHLFNLGAQCIHQWLTEKPDADDVAAPAVQAYDEMLVHASSSTSRSELGASGGSDE